MYRRFLLMLSLSLVLGGYFYSGNPWVFLIFTALLAAGGYGRDSGRIVRITAIILAFLTGAAAFGMAGHRYELEKDRLCSAGRVSFSGIVSSHSSAGDSTRIVLSSVTSGEVHLSGHLIIYVDSDEYSIGTRLSGEGSILEIRQRQNDGGFDETSYLRCQNIVAKLDDVIISSAKKGFWLYEMLDHMSFGMRAFYESRLPGEEGGILSAMCLGQKNALDRDAKELFSSVGLGHIFAISGLHISVVGMSVYRLMRKRRFSFAFSGIVSAVILILYGIMVGPSPSSVRAIGMFMVYIIAQITGCAYDMSSSAALLLILEFMDNPLLIGHSGLIMSFLAVFFISSLLLPAVERVDGLLDLGADARRGGDTSVPKRLTIWERVGKALFSSFLIQIALIPVVAMLYYRVPGYAVFLNMILLPAVGPFLLLSLLSGIISLYHPLLAGIIIRPCHFIIYFYEWCCDSFGRLPGGSVISGYPGIIRCGIYYLILLLAFFVWSHRQDVRAELTEAKAPWRRGKVSAFFGSRKEMISFGILFTAMLCVLFIRPHEAFSVTMLSVGQGDGLCIETGKGGHVFIDGGSSSESEIGRYTLQKYFDHHGIDHIDIWFLTHFDLDHISGCMELVEQGFPVRRLILAEEAEKNENYDSMMRLCRQHKVIVSYVSAGDHIGLHDLSFTVLSPRDHGYEGANENSLVLWMKYRIGHEKEAFDAVFTGDIGQEQEEDIIESGWFKSMISDFDGTVDLLKAAHHGSNYSNCEKWLEALSPRLCIISAGEGNRYGHPGAEALERMDESGIPHLCTIDSGQIRVRWDKGRMYTEKYLNS